MKFRPSIALLIFTALLFFIAVPRLARAHHSSGTGISKFEEINKDFYRGGHLHRPECLELKNLGIKTVIDLRERSHDQEGAEVRRAGMKYFQIRLSNARPASPNQTARFLALVNDPANWPVYVHCAEGQIRSGAMTAIYRITHDSWTANQAYQEMKRYGFHSFPDHGSWKDYVYNYYREYETQTAAGNANPEENPG